MAFVIPHVFKAGEKAVAEHVNENFSYLKQTIEDVNVNLDAKINSTISSTKENLEETLKTYCDEGDAKKSILDLLIRNQIKILLIQVYLGERRIIQTEFLLEIQALILPLAQAYLWVVLK